MTPRDLLAEMFQVCHTGGENPGHTGDPTIPPAPTEELEEAEKWEVSYCFNFCPLSLCQDEQQRENGWVDNSIQK